MSHSLLPLSSENTEDSVLANLISTDGVNWRLTCYYFYVLLSFFCSFLCKTTLKNYSASWNHCDFKLLEFSHLTHYFSCYNPPHPPQPQGLCKSACRYWDSHACTLLHTTPDLLSSLDEGQVDLFDAKNQKNIRNSSTVVCGSADVLFSTVWASKEALVWADVRERKQREGGGEENREKRKVGGAS